MFLKTFLQLFKSNSNADKVMDNESKDQCMRQLNAEKVMDKETKDKYIRQLNYQNRMKIKELEQKEEQAFQMIPARPIPYGIKKEYIDNDDGEYLQPHNYITIISATESASNEAEKSPGNETLNTKGKELLTNKKETTVSANDINVNIRSLNDIYDGDRGQNNEQNLRKNDSLQSELLNHGSENNKVQEQNTFEMWRLEVNAVPSIYAVPSLDETNLCKDFTPKYELFNHGSKLNENDQDQNPFQMWRLDAAPHIYDRMAEPEPAIDISIDQQTELPEISKAAPININKNCQEQNELSTVSKSISTVPHETGVNMSDDLPQLPLNMEVVRCKLRVKHILIGACIAVMMAVAGICFMAYYSTLSNTKNSRENPTASNDVAPTTTDVAVTTNTAVVVTYDVAVTSYNVTLTTKNVAMTSTDVAVSTFNVAKTINNVVMTISDVALTTNDVECLNFETKCIRFKRKITDNKFARDELARASGSGNIVLVCELLKCGVSANSRDKKGHTPLKRAAAEGHLKVAQLLLTYNASVDKDKGNSPLHMASLYGRTEVVKLLLTYYASVDQTLPIGPFSPLYFASQEGHTEVVNLLLTYNASVNKSTEYGWTPLHVAVLQDRDVIVDLLCNAGADVNAQTVRSTGIYKVFAQSTPLHVAVIKKNMRIVKTLIFHKAELLKDSNGLTALDISRQQNLSDITEVLEGI